MRESATVSASPSSRLVVIASKRNGILRVHPAIAEKPSFCRVSSDEGSDEVSFHSPGTMTETDADKAPASLLLPATACVGNPVVSDSEHDDSSSSTSSLAQKSDEADLDQFTSQVDGETMDHVAEKNAPSSGFRKRPKKRKRLDPGQVDYGGTLVCPLHEKFNDTRVQTPYSPEQKRRRTHAEPCTNTENDEQMTENKNAEEEHPPKPSSILCMEQTDECSRLGSPNVDLSVESPARFAPGSTVEIVGGIYVGRRGIVKEALQDQILVRVPAFSLQIDRWLEPQQLRLLEDCELLKLLNECIAEEGGDVLAERSFETVYQQKDPTIDLTSLDLIEPLPFNEADWAEDGSVDRDGLAAFVKDIFDPILEFEENHSIGTIENSAASEQSGKNLDFIHCEGAQHDENPRTMAGVEPQASDSNRRVEGPRNEDQARLCRKRVTASSFDLQETLEVVTRVIDEVAVARRNSPEFVHDCEKPRASESTDVADSTADRKDGACDRSQHEERHANASSEPDQTSEFVDSSIVEAFAPAGHPVSVHEGVCNVERVIPSQKIQTEGAAPVYEQGIETDCEELLADIVDHLPKGLFGEGFVGSEQWEPVAATHANPKVSGNDSSKRKREMFVRMVHQSQKRYPETGERKPAVRVAGNLHG